MKAFTFERASSVEAAAKSAASNPGAKFIAGGTNLLDLMKLEIETPTHLIDVNGLGLDKIETTENGGLRVGAMVRNTDLASDATVRIMDCSRVHSLQAHPGSFATRLPLRAIFCSAHVVLIFTTQTSPATSGSRAAAVPPLAVSAANTRLSVSATPALLPIQVIWLSQCVR